MVTEVFLFVFRLSFFSIVHLEVHFIVHWLGIRILAKLILLIFYFTLLYFYLLGGWSVWNKLCSRSWVRRGGEDKQSFGWRLLPLDCKIHFYLADPCTKTLFLLVSYFSLRKCSCIFSQHLELVSILNFSEENFLTVVHTAKKAGTATNVWLANQIRVFRIPARWDASGKQ